MSKSISWRQLPPNVLADVLAICDGHSILSPMAFIEAGVPAELAFAYDKVHTSDPKEWLRQISDPDGNSVTAVTGVYCLDVLEVIAADLGVSKSRIKGRGARARDLKARIRQHLGLPPQ